MAQKNGVRVTCLSRTNSATSEGISNLWAYFETPPNVDLSEERIASYTPFAAIRGLKMNANKYMKKSIIMRSIWGVSQIRIASFPWFRFYSVQPCKIPWSFGMMSIDALFLGFVLLPEVFTCYLVSDSRGNLYLTKLDEPTISKITFNENHSL